MAMWRMRIDYWITKATDTLRLYNTNCFSTVTVVSRRRLSITFIRTFPVFFLYRTFMSVASTCDTLGSMYVV